MGPQLYLILALAATGPATYGYMWVKQQIVVKQAYDSGKKVGAEQAAVAINAASRDRVTQFEQGQREAEPVPADKQRLIELCKRSASCRANKTQ